jgi:hypothetical protein
VTGKRVGPGLFESMAALGKERSLSRLRSFAQKLGGETQAKRLG